MQQSEALAILKTGVNVFLTGEPGAGKTHTINEYVQYLRSHGIQPAITASTGIAATHIGGMTIHSWSGIGISKSLTSAEIRAIVGKSKIRDRITGTNVLIIDEISMLDGNTLGLLDAVCRAARESHEAFGGMQVVFVGDFFQLPPVSRPGDPSPVFSFASDVWARAKPTICYLSEQHRQEDAEFLEVLSALRSGRIEEAHKARLRTRQVSLNSAHEEAKITKLFPHNAEVDRMNTGELGKLRDEAHTYVMVSRGAPNVIEQLKRGCLSPPELVLKKGARVMFTKNSFFTGYVNGTTGEVAGFAKESGYPLVRLRNGHMIEVEPVEWKVDVDGRPLAVIAQLPLRLAWAMTVHKSQGMSLDAAFIDLSQAFAFGQGYVALSRVRTLAGLYLGGLNDRALEVDQNVLAVDAEFRNGSDDVRFAFGAKSQDAVRRLHEEFILRCGGLLAQVDRTKSSTSIEKKPKKSKEPRWEKTLALVLSGKSIAEVAAERGRTAGTIIDHLEELKSLGKLPPETLEQILGDAKPTVAKIHIVFKEIGAESMKPVFERLEGRFSYDQIRFARLFYR